VHAKVIVKNIITYKNNTNALMLKYTIICARKAIIMHEKL